MELSADEVMMKITRSGKSHYQSISETQMELLIMGDRLFKIGRISIDEMEEVINLIKNSKVIELMRNYGELMNTVSDGLRYEIVSK